MESGLIRRKKILINNSSLIDCVHDAVLQKRSIFVENGIIKKISLGRIRSVSGAEVINAEEKFVMPGLFDMHAHCLDPVCFSLFLYNGVTSIRDVANQSKNILTWRQEIEEGKILGPRIFCTGELIDGPRAIQYEPQVAKDPFRIFARNEEEAVKIVSGLASKGVDGIKLYARLEPNVFRRCVQEAHKRNLPVAVHVSRFLTVSQVVRLGVDSAEHAFTLVHDLIPQEENKKIVEERKITTFWLKGFVAWSKIDLNGQKAKKLARFLAESNVYLVPTLVTYEKMVRGNIPSETTENPNLKYLSSDILEKSLGEPWSTHTYHIERMNSWRKEDYEEAAKGFEKMKRFVKMLFDTGVRLGVGSDTPMPWVIPGFSMIREMELFVESGIPPMRVIQSATRGSASFLGKRFADLGTIEEGKKADLIVISESPIENITNIGKVECVIRENNILSRNYLEKQMGVN